MSRALYVLCVSIIISNTGLSKNDQSTAPWIFLIKITDQMDQIYRESHRVYSQQKLKDQQSVFGKLHRALLAYSGEKLLHKSFLSCDQYLIETKKGSEKDFFYLDAFQRCTKKSAKQLFAKVNYEKKDRLQMTFMVGNLTDIVGLKTSIINHDVVCDIQLGPKLDLSQFSCKELSQDLNAKKIIQWSQWVYNKSAEPQIQAQGQIIQDLWPLRKVDFRVPQKDKIKIVEIELTKPTENEQKPSATSIKEVLPISPPPPIPIDAVPKPDEDLLPVTEAPASSPESPMTKPAESQESTIQVDDALPSER